MKSLKTILLLTILITTFSSLPARAEDDPLWLQESEQRLNSGVSNNTYRLTVLNTYGPSKKMLADNRLYALEKYVKDTYDAVPSSVVIDSVSGGRQPVYWVNFRTASRDDNFIVAKLVDEYTKFDDYETNVFQYEYYQLYALSNLNEYPQYDNFELSSTYRAKAVAMSIIPGLGQFYKGQKTKGYVILGGEIALVGAALVFESKKAYCSQQMQDEPMFAGSWESKRNAWRAFRNISIGAGAVLYLFNLYDAATSEGGRILSIKRPAGGYMSMTPIVAPQFAGVSMTVKF